MKIFISGASGFLGSYIAKALLERGHRLRTLSRSKRPELEALGIDVVQGELDNPVTVNNCIFDVDAVFHVAAKAGIWGSWDSYFRTNVIGTRNILLACRTHKISRLVYTSTPSVVYNGKDHINANETLPYGEKFVSHYAHTKRIAEEEVLAANSPQLRTVALRPHLIVGPGDPHIVPTILSVAKQGRLRIVGDGTNLVDITHVENVTQAHLLAFDALESGVAAGNPYFISNDNPTNLWDYINSVVQDAGLPKIEKHISLKKAYALGAVLEGLYKLLRIKSHPPMTRFAATQFALNHYFDISNAKKDLGYLPHVSIDLTRCK